MSTQKEYDYVRKGNQNKDLPKTESNRGRSHIRHYYFERIPCNNPGSTYVISLGQQGRISGLLKTFHYFTANFPEGFCWVSPNLH